VIRDQLALHVGIVQYPRMFSQGFSVKPRTRSTPFSNDFDALFFARRFSQRLCFGCTACRWLLREDLRGIKKPRKHRVLSGGGEETRTPDPLHAEQVQRFNAERGGPLESEIFSFVDRLTGGLAILSRDFVTGFQNMFRIRSGGYAVGTRGGRLGAWPGGVTAADRA
jgi:hypothetical protein